MLISWNWFEKKNYILLPIVQTLTKILSRYGFQFKKYHHAPGTFNCNVMKETSQTLIALGDPLELF